MNRLALALLFAASPAYACDWQVSRSVDPMTDVSRCTITSPTSQLGVGVRGSAVMFVIGGKLPSDSFKVRVDDRPAHLITRKGVSTQAFEPDARNLLSDLQTGTTVRTQHTRWPELDQVNSEAPICNLPELIASCQEKAN